MELRKRLLVLWIGLLALMPLSLVAAAIPSDSGSISCGGNYIAVRSLGQGTVRHYVPSSSQVAVFTNPTFQHRSNTTTISSATWKVTAGEALAEPTFAWCYGN